MRLQKLQYYQQELICVCKLVLLLSLVSSMMQVGLIQSLNVSKSSNWEHAEAPPVCV